MKRASQVVLTLIAIVFVLSGLRWYVDPKAAAAQIGMPLLDGVARSSQIGDLAAFFLLLGLSLLTGLVTAKRQWFQVPVILLVLAAISRVLAWALHDAALALHLIVPELVMATVIWFASYPASAAHRPA